MTSKPPIWKLHGQTLIQAAGPINAEIVILNRICAWEEGRYAEAST